MKNAARVKVLGAILLFACTSSALVQAAPPRATSAAIRSSEARQLSKLANDYYLNSARFEPLYFSFSGDSRFDDQMGLSISPAVRSRRLADLTKFAQRLQAIDATKLAREERTNHDILDYEIRNATALLQFPNHLLPINQMMFSFPLLVANLGDGKSFQPMTTPAQYRAYLKRIKGLTPWIDQAIANMREGIRTGVVLPKALIISALPPHSAMVTERADNSRFYAAVKIMPSTFSDAEKRSLAAAFTAEIEQHLNPALARLARFLEQEYLPAGRDSAGLGALPNGASWYQAQAANSTSTSLTPENIHAIGLAEVARIQQRFAELGPKLGYDGPPAGLPKWVGEQAKFKPFKNEQEILDSFRQLDTALSAKLPAVFTLIPKAPLEQRLEPELTRAAASDHYTGPSTDGKRPGIFWSVVNDPTTYDRTKMTSLYMHEGRPGHHFQVALQLERPLPDFRRFGGNNAFSEGWALYAESLGQDLGMFDDPAQYFGFLNQELLRAARLVVDTGLHAKGWSRERAIAYLRETNGYSEAVAKNAIERYMAWPGQALGYKVGALKIAALRQRATAALGAKFSLSAFHAVVIEDGNVPLAVLEQKVDRWIAASK
jgi:uncharacterized protein (DUF885 family)